MKKKFVSLVLILCLLTGISIPSVSAITGFEEGVIAAALTAPEVVVGGALLLGVAFSGAYVANHGDELAQYMYDGLVGLGNSVKDVGRWFDRAAAGVLDTGSAVWEGFCELVNQSRDNWTKTEAVLPGAFIEADIGTTYKSYYTYTITNMHKTSENQKVFRAEYAYTLQDDYYYHAFVSAEPFTIPEVSYRYGTVSGPKVSAMTIYNPANSNEYVTIYRSVPQVNTGKGDTVYEYTEKTINSAYWYLFSDYATHEDIATDVAPLPIDAVYSTGSVSIPELMAGTGSATITDVAEKVRTGAVTYTQVVELTQTVPAQRTETGELTAVDTVTGTLNPAIPVPTPTVMDYEVHGLDEIFPFCIPFDIYKLLEVLASPAQAPRMDLDYNLLGKDLHLEIDLSRFDSVAAILRDMELLVFCIGLAMKTRDLIRG